MNLPYSMEFIQNILISFFWTNVDPIFLNLNYIPFLLKQVSNPLNHLSKPIFNPSWYDIFYAYLTDLSEQPLIFDI